MVLTVKKQKKMIVGGEVDASGGGCCNRMEVVEVDKDKAKEDLIRYENTRQRYEETELTRFETTG